MQIKLLKELDGNPIDSILDYTDELVAKSLIADGTAVEYTDTVKKLERDIVIKSINILVPKTSKENKMSDKNMFGKAMAELVGMARKSNGYTYETKAVVGMSEGGSGTGDSMVYTALTEMQGIWAGATSIYDKCSKRTLPAGASAVNVLVDTFTEYAQGSAPIITGVAEGDAKNVNAAPTLSSLVQPKIVQTVVGVTDEELEDVPYLDSYLRSKLTAKFANKKDQLILAGTYGATVGFRGISTVGSAYVTTCSYTTPTLAQIIAFETAIEPELRNGAEWVMGVAKWAQIQATFLTAANLGGMIVDAKAKTLLGYNVNVSGNTDKIMLGNWRNYTVVESRLGERIDTSIHVQFLTDQTLFRIVSKLGGTPSYAVRTAVDSSTVGAFASN